MKLRVDHEPSILAADESAVVRAGQTVEIRCTAKGGNPIPTLTFTRGGQTFGPGPRPFQNTHTFVVSPGDNNAVLGCIAQNQADRRALSKEIRLNVLCEYCACLKKAGFKKCCSNVVL